MIWRFWSILILVGATALAQSPVPTISAKPAVASLSPADAEQAIKLLAANYVDSTALKGQSLNAATLEDFLTRLHGGAQIVSATTGAAPVAFYSDVIANHIGYVRFGTLSAENLRALESALANFETKKIDALVIDLRATPPSNDFEIAAEFAKRVLPKGKVLWRLHKANATAEQTVTNERAPTFSGPTMVLIDTETTGPTEAIAAAIRAGARAVSIGQLTAGDAVAFTDFKLPSGKTFRVATTAAVDPEGHALFPGGVKPDVSVELAPAKKQQIFSQSAQRGMSGFVFESGRPHFNEASLMAGTNPELEPSRKTKPEDNLHDPVLQRAVDVITSLNIFAKH